MDKTLVTGAFIRHIGKGEEGEGNYAWFTIEIRKAKPVPFKDDVDVLTSIEYPCLS